jgi:uncharacterized protein YegL
MKGMTLINIILDRSGSMASLGTETVGMFNRFLEEQKELDGYAELSLFQFDDKYEVNYDFMPIKNCKPLVYGKTYEPRGMTALLDAIGKTINNVGVVLSATKESNRPNKVMFIIITDGEENASKEFTKGKIKDMIKHQEQNYKWNFSFLGAGIDAINEGSKIGLTRQQCVSFDNSSNGRARLGKVMSHYTSAYRAVNINSNISISDSSNI